MKSFKRISAVVLSVLLVVSVLSACALTPAAKLKGAWRDSTGTVGYEFLDDNLCKITYADVTIPIINIRYDGTVDGTYSVEKRDDGNYYVTVRYTLLTSSIESSYMFVVQGDTLTLTEVESGSSTTYMKYTPSQSTSSPSETAAQ